MVKGKQGDLSLNFLAKAHERVGKYPARRLRWLLDFAYLNLDAIDAEQFGALRWDLADFGVGKGPYEKKTLADIFFEIEVLRLPLSWPPYNAPLSAWTELNKELAKERGKGAHPEIVRKFQVTMRNAFDILATGQQWRVQRPTYEEGIALPIRTPDKSFSVDNPPGFNGHDFLSMQAIDLIKAEKDRLKACRNPRHEKLDGRKKLFVAEKKGRAMFCESKCSTWYRMNKARGKL